MTINVFFSLNAFFFFRVFFLAFFDHRLSCPGTAMVKKWKKCKKCKKIKKSFIINLHYCSFQNWQKCEKRKKKAFMHYCPLKIYNRGPALLHKTSNSNSLTQPDRLWCPGTAMVKKHKKSKKHKKWKDLLLFCTIVPSKIEKKSEKRKNKKYLCTIVPWKYIIEETQPDRRSSSPSHWESNSLG
jgi:hypothetical protein